MGPVCGVNVGLPSRRRRSYDEVESLETVSALSLRGSLVHSEPGPEPEPEPEPFFALLTHLQRTRTRTSTRVINVQNSSYV